MAAFAEGAAGRRDGAACAVFVAEAASLNSRFRRYAPTCLTAPPKAAVHRMFAVSESCGTRSLDSGIEPSQRVREPLVTDPSAGLAQVRRGFAAVGVDAPDLAHGHRDRRRSSPRSLAEPPDLAGGLRAAAAGSGSRGPRSGRPLAQELSRCRPCDRLLGGRRLRRGQAVLGEAGVSVLAACSRSSRCGSSILKSCAPTTASRWSGFPSSVTRSSRLGRPDLRRPATASPWCPSSIEPPKALPGISLVGGLAGGPSGSGSTRLYLDGRTVDRGAVGMLIAGRGERGRGLGHVVVEPGLPAGRTRDGRDQGGRQPAPRARRCPCPDASSTG